MADALQPGERWDTTMQSVTPSGLSRAAFPECVRRYVAAGLDASAAVADLERCARQARQEGARAEDVVVAIRTAWYEAQPDARLPSSALKADLLRATGLALKAYFRDD